jgi:hypothetical protein
MAEREEPVTALRLYLLGGMSQQEREAFEERFFDDDAFAEEALAVESELIDACVRGELDASERERLEALLQASQRGRDALAFARALAGRGREAPAGRRAGPLRSRLLAAAACAAVVGGALLTRSTRGPAPTGAPAPPASAQPAQPGPSAAPAARPGRPVSVLLFAQTRGQDVEQVALDADVDALVLLLALEGPREDAPLRAVVRSRGREIGRAEALRPRIEQGLRVVSAELAAASLAAGEYEVSLEAVRAGGTWEPVGDFAFRIARR